MSMRNLFGQKNKMKTGLLIPSALLFALAGCGGGGGGGGTTPPPADILSGTAAAGAAIIGQVTVKGSAGNVVSALIEANGNYNVDVSTLTAPYMLRAEGTVGGRNYELHSFAEEADVGATVNITPFTDLIVSNAAGQIASAYFDDFEAQNVADPITPTELEEQETALQAKLQDVFDDLGVDAAVDLLHTTFSADHTDLDAALDLVRVEVDSGTNVATITNLIDSSFVSDDITDATDNTEVLAVDPLTDLATVQSDYEAIATRLADFSALFVGGLPNSTQVSPYFSADFLANDQGKAEFLTFITTTPNLVGLTFSNVTIEALDQTAGTATVSFHVGFGGVVSPEADVWEVAKSGTVWEMRGDRQIADIWMGFICDHSFWPDGSEYKSCGINLGVEDGDATNNPGGVLVDSARVSLVRNGMPVMGSEIYMGVPTAGGFAGELHVYDQDYGDDYMGFGTGAFQLDPSLIQVGDQVQFEVFTDALDLTDTNNPAVVGTPIATYTKPVVAMPHSDGTTAAYPVVSQSTLSALGSYSGGNLAVTWTRPTGMMNESVLLEVCDGTTCLEAEDWTLGEGTSATLTIDTSSLDLTASYTAELRVYAMDIYGQSFLTTHYVNISGDSGGGGGTPPPGGTTLTCSTESGWDDTADGGLGAPITPYSFADYEAVVADCGTAQPFTRADVAGNSFDEFGETTTFNDTGAAATAADPETGSFDDGAGFVISFEWYIEDATCAGCTHSYLVLYTSSIIDSAFPAGHEIRETNALTGMSGSTFTFTTYSEGGNYGDMVRSTGADGEIWSSSKTLIP